ncbi:MAG: TauD/TfdA family dioxygenase, partial [Alphaproteobacteria bacterium]|nr:TauD/TfdA family dioxygenase [Alphaproteobacteria bacterium]
MERTSRIEPVAGPSLWSAEELAARGDWIIRVDAAALDDIAAALDGVKRRRIALADISAEDFPLPSMAAQLSAIKALLSDGPGVALIRGLPVDQYDQSDLGLMLWGIGAHIGTGVVQSYRGDLIGEVMDMTHTGDARRAYRSPRPLDLHTDSADIAALLCLRRAKSGGMSLITSSYAVHDAMLAERPDLMPYLYRGYHYQRSEADSSGESPTTPHRIPVFAESGGRLACFFNANSIERAIEAGNVEVEPAAVEAFELFDATAGRDDLLFRQMLEPGDLQFLNNRIVMHGRTAFEDFDELPRKRLLLRVWLKM